jgi:NAD-dependent SIR2 family protein deacetylase
MFNNDLLRDLAEDRVVLFVGAGVSASAEIAGDSAFKGWPAFLEVAAQQCEADLRHQVHSLIVAKDYLLACQLLQDLHADGWQDLVTAEYGKAAEPSRLHRSLMSLNQRIVITTNFDKLIEAAWTQHVKSGSRNFKVISTIDSNVFRILKDLEAPYLIKIRGSVDKASSLVFSRSEYIRMAFGNQNYATFLDSILLNYTILFV